MEVIRLGSAEQNVLSKSGDDLRIDWGHFYIAAPREGKVETLGTTARRRALYAATLELPESQDLDPPVQTDRDVPLAAVAYEFEVPAEGRVARRLILAYDDIWSIEYFQRKLRPYWRRKGMGAEALLKTAAAELPRLRERCLKFDAELAADLTRAGGAKYAALSTLAYRQTLAAHKLAADFDGSPLYFSKENFSNGCIATVDVTYPSAPFFLLFNPRLLEAPVAAGTRLRALGALAVALRAARPGAVSAGERAGLWRRRGDRGAPDAGGGERQHAHPAGRAGEDPGERGVQPSRTGRC